MNLKAFKNRVMMNNLNVLFELLCLLTRCEDYDRIWRLEKYKRELKCKTTYLRPRNKLKSIARRKEVESYDKNANSVHKFVSLLIHVVFFRIHCYCCQRSAHARPFGNCRQDS